MLWTEGCQSAPTSSYSTPVDRNENAFSECRPFQFSNSSRWIWMCPIIISRDKLAYDTRHPLVFFFLISFCWSVVLQLSPLVVLEGFFVCEAHLSHSYCSQRLIELVQLCELNHFCIFKLNSILFATANGLNKINDVSLLYLMHYNILY